MFKFILPVVALCRQVVLLNPFQMRYQDVEILFRRSDHAGKGNWDSAWHLEFGLSPLVRSGGTLGSRFLNVGKLTF